MEGTNKDHWVHLGSFYNSVPIYLWDVVALGECLVGKSRWCTAGMLGLQQDPSWSKEGKKGKMCSRKFPLLSLCCCFFSHVTSDPPSAKEGRLLSILPFPAGFCCAPGKRGHRQRAHNIWRWRCHRVLRAAAPRNSSAHFFQKRRNRGRERSGPSKVGDSWNTLCVLQCRDLILIALHKEALIWFHFFPSDSIFGVWVYFYFSPFAWLRHWGSVLRHLKSKSPKSSRAGLGAHCPGCRDGSNQKHFNLHEWKFLSTTSRSFGFPNTKSSAANVVRKCLARWSPLASITHWRWPACFLALLSYSFPAKLWRCH